VILGIFAFGCLLTGALWLYTWQHHARFYEFRRALVQEFTKRSVPRVDGGREKGRGPLILRVVLNVEIDLAQSGTEHQARLLELERRTFRLAQQHVADLPTYERWEFCLVHLVPEGNPQRYESKRDFSEALQVLPEPSS